MECTKAISLMHEYLDDELQSADMILLKEHMLGCSSCRNHFKWLERTEATIGAMAVPAVPDGLTERIMQSLPRKRKQSTWVNWVKRHPAATAAALFFVVMMGSFMTMWNQSSELVVKGSDLDQLVIQGNTVIVPAGTKIGNLTVENGKTQVYGEVVGDLTVIDGTLFQASTAHISGHVNKINQAVDWLWYKIGELFVSK